jgi:hypothetical protein
VPLIVLLLLLPLVFIVMTPVLLIQRYRVGSSRRLARPWMATLNLISMIVSAVVFEVGSGITNIWVPHAFLYASEGLAIGCVLGVAALALTNWEPAPASLHFTPNRWLVLFVTLIVSMRVVFGLYRAAMAAEAGVTGHELIGAFGVAESLGAGGVVIGYYVAYTAGVKWRVRRWQRRTLRRM